MKLLGLEEDELFYAHLVPVVGSVVVVQRLRQVFWLKRAPSDLTAHRSEDLYTHVTHSLP